MKVSIAVVVAVVLWVGPFRASADIISRADGSNEDSPTLFDRIGSTPTFNAGTRNTTEMDLNTALLDAGGGDIGPECWPPNVPEPTTAVLLGLFGLGLLSRRWAKKSA
jgi:hypothetical protein